MVRTFVAALICLVGSLGCATGTPFEAVAVPPGKAVIYVYRPSEGYAGSAVNFEMMCDGAKFGDLGNGGYVHTIVAPGKHVISTKTEAESAVPFEAQVGKSYYIEAVIRMGFWVGQPRLTMVPEETGKLAILSQKNFVKPPDPAPAAAPTKK